MAGEGKARPKIALLSRHFIGCNEIDRTVVCKGSNFENIFGSAKILITQPKVESQVLSCFPTVLKKVRLAEQVGIIDGNAKLPLQAATPSAEIIQKIGKCGNAGTGRIN